MNTYRITFGYNGQARVLRIDAESDGEAIEKWELWADSQEFADIEFVSCIEEG